jgi:hypothetical protein
MAEGIRMDAEMSMYSENSATVKIPRDSKMEEDTDMEENDIEFELQHLKQFGNEKQLDLLRREVGHIVAHGLNPCEGWYDERFEHINLYSKLDWPGLARRFHNKDKFLHDTAIYIMRLSDELLEERGTKPNFHIATYHILIHSVQSVWDYYKQVYCADEDDTDIMDLIEGIKFM